MAQTKMTHSSMFFFQKFPNFFIFSKRNYFFYKIYFQYQSGADSEMGDGGRFTLLLEQAIERSLSLPGNPAVDIFTQIIEGLRPPSNIPVIEPNDNRPRINPEGANTNRCLCVNNENVSKSFYETNNLPRSCPNDYMLVAFSRSPDAELLIVGVHRDFMNGTSANAEFNGFCVGCDSPLRTYSDFCSHFNIPAGRPKEETLRYYCMVNDNLTLRSTEIPIPWPTSTNQSPPVLSQRSPQRSAIVIVPDQLFSVNGGKICILKCMTTSPLEMEDNHQAIQTSTILSRYSLIHVAFDPKKHR